MLIHRGVRVAPQRLASRRVRLSAIRLHAVGVLSVTLSCGAHPAQRLSMLEPPTSESLGFARVAVGGPQEFVVSGDSMTHLSLATGKFCRSDLGAGFALRDLFSWRGVKPRSADVVLVGVNRPVVLAYEWIRSDQSCSIAVRARLKAGSSYSIVGGVASDEAAGSQSSTNTRSLRCRLGIVGNLSGSLVVTEPVTAEQACAGAVLGLEER